MYRIQSLLKAIGLLILMVGPVSATASVDQAWDLYSKARSALNEGNYRLAEQIAKQALAIHEQDGHVRLNKEVHYRMIPGGQGMKWEPVITGEVVSYRPNQLMEEIESHRQSLRDRARLAHKEMSPPDLRLLAELIDEDQDGLFQEGEPLTLLVDIVNRGENAAHGLVLYIHAEPAIDGVEASRSVQVLEPDAVFTEQVSFTIPKGFAPDTVTFDIRADEMDGYSPPSLSVTKPVLDWTKPELQIVADNRALQKLVPGRANRLEFTVTNVGDYTARHVNPSPNLDSAQFTILDRDWPAAGVTLKPGHSETLSLIVKPSITVEEGAGTVLALAAKGSVEQQFMLTATAAQQLVQGEPVRVAGGSQITELKDGYVPPLPTNGVERGNDFAIVIGNASYQNLNLPVRYAERDARLMAGVFEQVLGLPRENIIHLPNATLAQMQTVLGRDGRPGILHRRLQGVENPGRVYVYYSGHGIPAKSRHWSAHLMPVDANVDYIETSGFALEELYRQLALLPAEDMVVFLDACFSGNTQQGPVFQGVSFGTLATPQIPDTNDARIRVLSAAGEDDLAIWLDQAKHGLFTTYLARGLMGEADTGDRVLQFSELYGYVRRKVSGAAAQMARSQTPTQRAESDLSLTRFNY